MSATGTAQGMAKPGVQRAPEFYVIPDAEMPAPRAMLSALQSVGQPSPNHPRYGEEVPRRDWQQNLEALTSAIEGHRASQPPYQPFPAGTPTQRRREFEAEVTGYYQGKPTFAREQAAIANALKAASPQLPGTQGERYNLATSKLLQSATSRYDQLIKAGYRYPLYYTINSLLRDPNWISAAGEAGADVRFVVDALIRAKGEEGQRTLEGYFSTETGSKLRPIYEDMFGPIGQDIAQDLAPWQQQLVQTLIKSGMSREEAEARVRGLIGGQGK